MKDGRAHFAHEAENAVDLDSGALLAVTVQDATHGDPTTMKQPIAATVENVRAGHRDPRLEGEISERGLTEWVPDKGYHSNATMEMTDQCGLRSYAGESRRPRRSWVGKNEREVLHVREAMRARHCTRQTPDVKA
jgi:transposase